MARKLAHKEPVKAMNPVMHGYLKPGTSLNDLRPDLAAEWDVKLNGNTTPSVVSCSSGEMIWWRCSQHEEHSWEMSINVRAKQNQGCPFCAGNKTSKTNSLKTTHPEIAYEWHPTKNNDLTPQT